METKKITSEAELDEILSRTTPDLVEMMGRLEGDIMILGIGGKMGTTVGLQALRAVKESGVSRRIIGVSRFSSPQTRSFLEEAGIETIACDLLDPESVKSLPRTPNVLFLAGRKFGTDGQEPLTWAINTYAAANVAKHYENCRIVAFSTGNVYPFVSPSSAGCTESTTPEPIGEYAQSCLGRERVFEYFCSQDGTPLCIYRLNYACDLRYGVLHDIGTRIWNQEPVDLTVGFVNLIWQGDASAIALLCLELCSQPKEIINVTGPEIFSVREIAEAFADIMDRKVVFTGHEKQKALLSNAEKATKLFGEPTVSLQTMIKWTAEWIMQGGSALGKPTHFNVNNGKF